MKESTVDISKRELILAIRNLILLGSASTFASCSWGLNDNPLSIEEQRQRVRDASLDYAVNVKGPVYWNVPIIAHNLTAGLPPEEGRKKLFKFVQSFPYEVVHYEGTNTDLLDHERGDCRHKRQLLYTLLEQYDQRVRKVGVVFDWKDLPIPSEIIAELKTGGTKGLHSALQLMMGENNWVYLEPSWDLGLEKAGFPVVNNWDGKSPTNPVTLGETIVYPQPYDMGGVMRKHGVRYVTSETNVFDQRLNAHLRQIRTISHTYDKPLEEEVQAMRQKK